MDAEKIVLLDVSSEACRGLQREGIVQIDQPGMCATPTGEAFALVRIIEREEWNKAQNILVTLDLKMPRPYSR